MDREAESVYLLDMALCELRSAISEEFRHGAWVSADYSIAEGEGRMIMCGPGTAAPPLTLDLGAEGWHHVFIATFRQQHQEDCCLSLKLTDDPGFTRATAETFRASKDLVPPEMIPGKADLSEAYWKTADLTRQQIVFHRPPAGEKADSYTNVTYVRLVPCSGREREWAESNATRTDTKRLLANYDGGQHIFWGYSREQDLIDEFQHFRGSDFRAVLWGAAKGTATYYPSRVGSEVRWPEGMPGHPVHANAYKDRRRRTGFDPLRAAVRQAHAAGVELYPTVRMTGERFPPGHLYYNGPGEFQREHPEWRCITREGHTTRHLSQAFPEVREKYVALFREWVEDYEADGVGIIFCRSYPYVLYEAPVETSFRKKYGESMHALDPWERRVLEHRSSVLTQLLREVRAMLDEVGEKRGRRLKAAYVIPGDVYTAPGCPDLGPFTTPRSHAMDVETWMREGLVDDLAVHLEDKRDPEGREAAEIVGHYASAAKGTATRVHADLYPRRQSADSMRIRAMACYDAGADGHCFWDSHGRATRLSGWAMHRLLGHREELAELKPFADSLFRLVPLVSLCGFMVQEDYGLPTDG